MNRREALGAGSLAACAAAIGPGCDRFVAALAGSFDDAMPDEIAQPRSRTKSAARHLLDRAAFGPRPGDVEHVGRIGTTAWIDEQLDPARIDDEACDLRTSAIDVGWLPSDLLFELRPEDIEGQLVTDTLLRAVYSRRQLREVMVGFWLDHFNVAIAKSLCSHLEATYVRDVIRPHALGSFRDLLGAVTRSGAMLVYLDGRDNRRSTPRDVPNENHARELLELHTLGVRSGYTQHDVMEAARALSGWVVDERWAPGQVRFVAERHDDGEKRVLGASLPAHGGEHDVDRLLDVLVRHDACATHVARKLATHLVADDPPERVVRAAADAFRQSRGHIAPVVRAILVSPELARSADAKVKRPFRFVVSALRALGAETHARDAIGASLTRMGHAPFRWPTPDGYPDHTSAWLGTLPARWSFALALVEGRIDGTSVDPTTLRRALGATDGIASIEPLFAHLLGRRPDASELDPVRAYVSGTGREDRALALMLASPAFQRH